MAAIKGERLGGVFLFKVPPGKKIYPHTDSGWHAEYYDKFNICIQGGAAFHYDDQVMLAETGDIHWFTNDSDHWIINTSSKDYITLTLSIRLDRGERIKWSS